MGKIKVIKSEIKRNLTPLGRFITEELDKDSIVVGDYLDFASVSTLMVALETALEDRCEKEYEALKKAFMNHFLGKDFDD